MIFMEKRKGRPKQFLTKSDILSVRLTKEQVYWLKCLMNKTAKTKSQIITEAIKIMYDEYK